MRRADVQACHYLREAGAEERERAAARVFRTRLLGEVRRRTGQRDGVDARVERGYLGDRVAAHREAERTDACRVDVGLARHAVERALERGALGSAVHRTATGLAMAGAVVEQHADPGSDECARLVENLGPVTARPVAEHDGGTVPGRHVPAVDLAAIARRKDHGLQLTTKQPDRLDDAVRVWLERIPLGQVCADHARRRPATGAEHADAKHRTDDPAQAPGSEARGVRRGLCATTRGTASGFGDSIDEHRSERAGDWPEPHPRRLVLGGRATQALR